MCFLQFWVCLGFFFVWSGVLFCCFVFLSKKVFPLFSFFSFWSTAVRSNHNTLFLEPVKTYLKAMNFWSTLFLLEGCSEALVTVIIVTQFSIQINWTETPCPAPVRRLWVEIFQNKNKSIQKEATMIPRQRHKANCRLNSYSLTMIQAIEKSAIMEILPDHFSR